MKLTHLLNSLEKVRSSGHGTWTARCPAHEDKHPSLAIRETEGIILMKCHAGCDVYDIVKAVGMEMDDLFPEKQEYHAPIKKPFPASAVLECIARDTIFLEICANDMMKGQVLTEDDRTRMRTCCEHLRAAVAWGFA